MKQGQVHLLPSLNWKVLLDRPKSKLPQPLDSNQGEFYYTRNAIWHSLKYLQLSPGDEILVPAYNSRSEVQALADYGLKLNHYDTLPNTQVDTEALEKQITPETKALYIIHYFGFSQPLDEIKKITKMHNLLLLEDCALALFSKYHGKLLGFYGDAGYFCYRKYLEIPNGGSYVLSTSHSKIQEMNLTKPALLSTLPELAGLLIKPLSEHYSWFASLYSWLRKKARAKLRGKKIDSGISDFAREHVNWQVSKISKYILYRLEIPKIINQRIYNYNYLKQTLKPLIKKNNKIRFLNLEEQDGFVPHCLPLVVHDNVFWQQALAKHNIETGAWWHYDPFFPNAERYPNNNWLRQHILEIPIHQDLSKKDMDYIVQRVKNIITKK